MTEMRILFLAYDISISVINQCVFSSFLIFIQSEVIISCAVKSIFYRLSRTDYDQTIKGISITWRLIESGIFFFFLVRRWYWETI